MGLEKGTGQVVSVEELVRRTVYRCEAKGGKDVGGGVDVGVEISVEGGELNVQNEVGILEGGGKKRKAEDREDGELEQDRESMEGREEKRACV